MPSIARSELPGYSRGPYTTEEAKWEGFTVAFESVVEDSDSVERFRALLGDGCQCPHWGYQLAGESSYVFADRVETFHPGEFFYIAPGHAPRHKAGSQWVCFSPTDKHDETQKLTRNEA